MNGSRMPRFFITRRSSSSVVAGGRVVPSWMTRILSPGTPSSSTRSARVACETVMMPAARAQLSLSSCVRRARSGAATWQGWRRKVRSWTVMTPGSPGGRTRGKRKFGAKYSCAASRASTRG